MHPMDAFLAKIEASDQRFFNPGSNHVKIPMKKEHFFSLNTPQECKKTKNTTLSEYVNIFESIQLCSFFSIVMEHQWLLKIQFLKPLFLYAFLSRYRQVQF